MRTFRWFFSVLLGLGVGNGAASFGCDSPSTSKPSSHPSPLPAGGQAAESATRSVAERHQGLGSATETRPAGKPTILPWLELNDRRLIVEKLWGRLEGSEGRVTYGEYCVRGLRYWARVTDAALITTSPGGLPGTYEYLMAHRPKGMRIIGGVKTYLLPGGTLNDRRPYDFADAAGWRSIAAHAQHIAKVTGNKICLLENETALTPFHRGQKIDLRKLENSLGILRETGIEFWWYLPSIQPNTPRVPDLQGRTVELIDTISKVLPDSRFVVDYIGYSGWRKNARTEATRRQMMIEKVGQSRILDYMFVTGDGYLQYENGRKRYCHTPQDAFAEIAGLSGVSRVSIYPGGKNWVSVARAFAEGYPRSEDPTIDRPGDSKQ